MRFSSVQRLASVLLCVAIAGCSGPSESVMADGSVSDAHVDAASGDATSSDASSESDGSAESDANVPLVRGAAVPWIEYEAELGQTNGQIVGPSRSLGTQAGEASGRRAVVLDALGEYVEWTTTAASNAIVVRNSIPDSAGGGGTQATISLYVDGSKRTSLTLSSKEAWVYGGDGDQFNSPGAGAPRRIYGESNALLGFTIPAGAVVRLSKDAGDSAPYYAIDFIDLEMVAPPIGRPAGYISITDTGHAWSPAVPNDGVSDENAINQCIQAAMSGQYQGVYFPPGRFDHVEKIQVHGITIQGAGMWHTRLHNGDLTESSGWGRTGFIITGDDTRFRDFAIFGSTDGLRNQGGKAWSNSAFNDTVIENMWVENVQCGYWVGGNFESNRLQIRNSRFRNTGADAVNLCNGTRDSVVENNHARNTGDDAFAIWSATDLYAHPAENNVIRHCTVQITWRAAAFAIYGGAGNRVEESTAFDTLTYPGITISSEFNPYPLESASVDGVTLVRTGGAYWGGQEFGSIWVRGDQNPTNGITVRNVDIVDPTFQGIVLQTTNGGTLTNVTFAGITIANPATYGIQVRGGAAGGATFSDVMISNAGVNAFLNDAQGSFTISKTGSNNW